MKETEGASGKKSPRSVPPSSHVSGGKESFVPQSSRRDSSATPSRSEKATPSSSGSGFNEAVRDVFSQPGGKRKEPSRVIVGEIIPASQVTGENQGKIPPTREARITSIISPNGTEKIGNVVFHPLDSAETESKQPPTLHGKVDAALSSRTASPETRKPHARTDIVPWRSDRQDGRFPNVKPSMDQMKKTIEEVGNILEAGIQKSVNILDNKLKEGVKRLDTKIQEGVKKLDAKTERKTDLVTVRMANRLQALQDMEKVRPPAMNSTRARKGKPPLQLWRSSVGIHGLDIKQYEALKNARYNLNTRRGRSKNTFSSARTALIGIVVAEILQRAEEKAARPVERVVGRSLVPYK